MNRGRIQAQDDTLEESESWATINNINKTDGLNKLNCLKSKLSPRQIQERSKAFDKVEDLIRAAPVDGHQAQLIKSFHHNPHKRKVRVDVEIRQGKAFTQ